MKRYVNQETRFVISDQLRFFVSTSVGEFKIIDFSENGSGLKLEMQSYQQTDIDINAESFLIDGVELPLHNSLFPINLRVKWSRKVQEGRFHVGVDIDRISSVNRLYLADIFSEYVLSDKNTEIESSHAS